VKKKFISFYYAYTKLRVFIYLTALSGPQFVISNEGFLINKELGNLTSTYISTFTWSNCGGLQKFSQIIACRQQRFETRTSGILLRSVKQSISTLGEKVTTIQDWIYKLVRGRVTDLLGHVRTYLGQRQTLRRCDAGHYQSTAQKTSSPQHRPTSIIREPFACNPDRFTYTSTLSLASFVFCDLFISLRR